MVGRAPDALSPDRLAADNVGTTAANTDTRAGKALPLPFAATLRVSLWQRSLAAHVPSHSSTIVLSFAHPFGCDILEGFSIQFRRGLFYIVTTCESLLLDTPKGRLLHYAVFFYFSILPSVHCSECSP